MGHIGWEKKYLKKAVIEKTLSNPSKKTTYCKYTDRDAKLDYSESINQNIRRLCLGTSNTI